MLHHRTLLHTLAFLGTALVSQSNALTLSVPNDAVVPGQPATVSWQDAASAPSFFRINLIGLDGSSQFVQDVSRGNQPAGQFSWSPPDVPLGQYTLQAVETVPPFDSLASKPVRVASQVDQGPTGPSSPPPPPPTSTSQSSTSKPATSPSSPKPTSTHHSATSNTHSSSSASHDLSASNNNTSSHSPSLPLTNQLAQVTGSLSLGNQLSGPTSDLTTPDASPSPSVDPATNDNTGATRRNFNTPAIAGAVFGTIVAVICLIGLFCFLNKRRRKTRPFSWHGNMMVREKESYGGGTYGATQSAGSVGSEYGYGREASRNILPSPPHSASSHSFSEGHAAQAQSYGHGRGGSDGDGYADDWLRNSRRVVSDISRYSQDDVQPGLAYSTNSHGSLGGHDLYAENHLETHRPMQVGGGMY